MSNKNDKQGKVSYPPSQQAPKKSLIEPDHIIIPEKHATVTKSHRIINTSPPISLSKRKRKSSGSDGRRKLSMAQAPESGDKKRRPSDKSRRNSSSANKNLSKKQKFLAALKSKLGIGHKSKSKVELKAEQLTEEEEEFKQTHVVSPVWAPEYNSAPVPNAFANNYKRKSSHKIIIPQQHGAATLPPIIVVPANLPGSPGGKDTAPDKTSTTPKTFVDGSEGTDKNLDVMSSGNETESMHTVKSGYVNLYRFTENIIMDPLVVKSWVQFWTKKLYLVWVYLILSVSLLNAFLIFVFYYVPEKVFSRDLLYRILLGGRFNVLSVVGVMLSLIAIAVWGCLMLTNPMPKSPICRLLRWPFVLILMGYIAFCIGTQAYECIYLHRELERSMVKDLIIKHKSTKLTRLESSSQLYFHCCGIKSFTDWRRYGHLNQTNRPDLKGGYPRSCCDKNYPKCSHTFPVPNYSIIDDKKEPHLWELSCLSAEYVFIIAVMCFIETIEGLCFIIMIGALILLKIVLKHTNTFGIEHIHPFS